MENDSVEVEKKTVNEMYTAGQIVGLVGGFVVAVMAKQSLNGECGMFLSEYVPFTKHILLVNGLFLCVAGSVISRYVYPLVYQATSDVVERANEELGQYEGKQMNLWEYLDFVMSGKKWRLKMVKINAEFAVINSYAWYVIGDFVLSAGKMFVICDLIDKLTLLASNF